MDLIHQNPKEFFKHLEKTYEKLSLKCKKIIPREKFSAFSIAIILVKERVVKSLLLEMKYSEDFIKNFGKKYVLGFSVDFRCNDNFIIIYNDDLIPHKNVEKAINIINNYSKINFILFDTIMNLIGNGYCRQEPENNIMKFLTLIDNKTKYRFKDIVYCVCYCSKDHLITRYILDKSNEIMSTISDKYKFIIVDKSFD
mgnify:CR=1 FL=1|uniref:Uncharacterized protein n=1 Tax=viral metagenome TaxID=1070528 RepID=A0A6C0ACB6_9ZZZZ